MNPVSVHAAVKKKSCRLWRNTGYCFDRAPLLTKTFCMSSFPWLQPWRSPSPHSSLLCCSVSSWVHKLCSLCTRYLRITSVSSVTIFQTMWEHISICFVSCSLGLSDEKKNLACTAARFFCCCCLDPWATSILHVACYPAASHDQPIFLQHHLTAPPPPPPMMCL